MTEEQERAIIQAYAAALMKMYRVFRAEGMPRIMAYIVIAAIASTRLREERPAMVIDPMQLVSKWREAA